MKYLMWLLKAAIFFTLFAFALNNQQVVAVNFFFGTVWKAPLVIVVLSVFATGLALGVLLMIPRWWKKKVVGKAGKAGHIHHSEWASLPESATSSAFAPAASVAPAPLASAAASVRATTHGL